MKSPRVITRHDIGDLCHDLCQDMVIVRMIAGLLAENPGKAVQYAEKLTRASEGLEEIHQGLLKAQDAQIKIQRSPEWQALAKGRSRVDPLNKLPKEKV